MSKIIARYSVSTGLAGCYMPNSVSCPMAFSTRRELAEAIRYEIAAQDFPKSTFAQVNIQRLWALIRHAKSSSSYHFSIEHKGFEIAFHGLTVEEFEQMEQEEI